MRKTITLVLLLMMTAVTASAQEKKIKVIKPSAYGTFDMLLGKDRYEIDSLVIDYDSDLLTAHDLELVGECCKKGRLTGIDMSRCRNIENRKIPSYVFTSYYVNAKPRKTETANDDERNDFYTNLRYITLPNCIETIDGLAFAYTNLEAIKIHANVEMIGYDAFYGCDRLKNITLCGTDVRPEVVINGGFNGVSPDAVLYVGPGMGDYYRSLDACSNLKVEESEDACRILTFDMDGSRTVADMFGEYDMNVDSVKLSGPLSKEDVALLKENIQFGELIGLELADCEIEEGNFFSCKIKSFRMPRKMKNIPRGFFSRTKIRNLTMPEHYEVICRTAFESSDCFADRTLVVPEGCRRIDYKAFCLCKTLKRVVLPSTMEVLEPNSLGFNWGYEIIPDVDLYVNRMYPPESIMVSGESDYDEKDGPFGCIENIGSNLCKTKGWRLYVPMGAKKNFENAEHWNHFETIIETPLLTGTATGISDAPIVRAYAADGIYTTDGRLVSKGTSPADLAKGLYIVRENGTTKKVIMGR